MRCVAIRHDASTYMHGRIVTDRNATHEKRIHVGRALHLPHISKSPFTNMGIQQICRAVQIWDGSCPGCGSVVLYRL